MTSPIPIDPIFDAAVVEDPYEYYADLCATDPVHLVAGTGTYLVTRLDLVHEVVSQPAVYSSNTAQFLHHDVGGGPGLRGAAPGADGAAGADGAVPGVLATADPPDHTRQRRVVTRALSSAAMQAMEPAFRTLVDRALDEPLVTGRVEWMGAVAKPLPMVMVARILGLPDDLAPLLERQGYASVEAIGGFVGDERLAELGAPMMDVGPVVDAYVAVRHHGAVADPATLIGVCARAAAAGELTDEEAFMILFLLVAAGGESTTSLTGSGVRILAERPDLQERLRAEPALVAAFVEEVCRIEPPFRGHYRRACTASVLGGVPIPAGASLVLAWPAANRDPAMFARPDDIDLDRPNPRQHTGFGWGIHLCVGAPLARVEARVAFERLLARTALFRLDAAAGPLRHHRSLMIRRLVELPLVLEPAPA